MPERTHRDHWLKRLLGIRFRGHDRAPDELYRPEKHPAARAEGEAVANDGWFPGPAREAEVTAGAQPAGPAAAAPWHEKTNYGGWQFPKTGPAAEAETTEADAAIDQALASHDSDAEIEAGLAEEADATDLVTLTSTIRNQHARLSAAADAEWEAGASGYLAAARAAQDAYDRAQWAAYYQSTGDTELASQHARYAREAHEHAEVQAAEAQQIAEGQARLEQTEADAQAEAEAADDSGWERFIRHREAEEARELADMTESRRSRAEIEAAIAPEAEAAAAEPEMGADYYTARPGSDAHRAAYAEYAEATGGVPGLEGYSIDEAYEIDNAAELDIERWQAEMEAGDPDAEADAGLWADKADPEAEASAADAEWESAQEAMAEDQAGWLRPDAEAEAEAEIMARDLTAMPGYGMPASEREAELEAPGPPKQTRAGDRAAETVARIDEVLAAGTGAGRDSAGIVYEASPRGFALEPEADLQAEAGDWF